MRDVTADVSTVAFCGLYCGACKSYLKGKCPGCRDNVKAKWCAVRSCGLEKGYANCAECREYENVGECKKLNNLISKLFALLFKSNRLAGIEFIKEKGIEEYVRAMSASKSMTPGKNG